MVEKGYRATGWLGLIQGETDTGSRGSLEPPGPLLTHLRTVYMAYSERLPTRLNPLAERACFSFHLLHLIFSYYAKGCMASCMRGHKIRYFPLAERTCSSQA
jgi:hypothetical protein